MAFGLFLERGPDQENDSCLTVETEAKSYVWEQGTQISDSSLSLANRSLAFLRDSTLSRNALSDTLKQLAHTVGLHVKHDPDHLAKSLASEFAQYGLTSLGGRIELRLGYNNIESLVFSHKYSLSPEGAAAFIPNAEECFQHKSYSMIGDFEGLWEVSTLLASGKVKYQLLPEHQGYPVGMVYQMNQKVTTQYSYMKLHFSFYVIPQK